MRFLLYNIRYGTGTGAAFHLPFPGSGYLRDTTRNLQKIIRFLQDQEADLLGLLEVDGGSYRSERQNQAEVIARALGHYHCYESKYGTRSLARALPVMNKQVNAFVTSNTIRAERFHYVRHGIKRLVIELEMRDLTVFLVHLSLKFRHRHSQLRDLSGLVRRAKKPCLVAGDFNARWGDEELALFLEATGLKNANTHGWPTYPSLKPSRQIDFILYSPGIRVRHFEIPRVRLSDHLPLVCDLEVRG